KRNQADQVIKPPAWVMTEQVVTPQRAQAQGSACAPREEGGNPADRKHIHPGQNDAALAAQPFGRRRSVLRLGQTHDSQQYQQQEGHKAISFNPLNLACEGGLYSSVGRSAFLGTSHSVRSF